MAQDLMRFFLILIFINLLMGTINIVSSNNTFSEGYGENTQSLSEEIKSNINDQVSSEANMPENYQTQTSAGSEQGMGKGVMLKLFIEGLKPFPKPLGGYETTVEQIGYAGIGIIRSAIYILTGILAFLIFFNKKT